MLLHLSLPGAFVPQEFGLLIRVYEGCTCFLPPASSLPLFFMLRNTCASSSFNLPIRINYVHYAIRRVQLLDGEQGMGVLMQ